MKTFYKIKRIAVLIALLLFGTPANTWATETALPSNTNPALVYWREFATMPEIDQDQFTRIREQIEVTDESREFAAKFDETFRRLAKTRTLTARCNWGDDLAEGPYLLLPYLTEARTIAQTVRVRAAVHFADGNEQAVVDELLSVYTLSSHISQSPILINLLVHYAIDRICAATIAEHFGQFSDDALRKLKAGIAGVPTPNTIADSVPTEQHFMAGWLRTELIKIRESEADAASAEAAARALLNNLFTVEQQDSAWNQFKQAGGSTVDGMIQLIDQANQDYHALEALCRKPVAKFLSEVKQFDQESKDSPNPIRRLVFPAISGAMSRELGNQVMEAMLNTAIEYRLEGNVALGASADPMGGKPFTKSVFQHAGQKAGFILESQIESTREKQMLFLLKPLPQYQVLGPNAGKEK